MEVTEIRIMEALSGPQYQQRIRAFCSITIDNNIAIRDLKLIEGQRGLFVAMPSRKLTDKCPWKECGAKNHLKANYCSTCGGPLNPQRAVPDDRGRLRLYADIVHPVNTATRELIQESIVDRWNEGPPFTIPEQLTGSNP